MEERERERGRRVAGFAQRPINVNALEWSIPGAAEGSRVRTVKSIFVIAANQPPRANPIISVCFPRVWYADKYPLTYRAEKAHIREIGM